MCPTSVKFTFCSSSKSDTHTHTDETLSNKKSTPGGVEQGHGGGSGISADTTIFIFLLKKTNLNLERNDGQVEANKSTVRQVRDFLFFVEMKGLKDAAARRE